MPTILITIPAPGFQRLPHAFAPHEWPEYYAEHAGAMSSLMLKAGALPQDVGDDKPPTTGIFPRVGGWATFTMEVPDLARAEAARDAYWSEQFAVQTPEDAAETADKVTDVFEQVTKVLASLFGAQVPALIVAADVAELIDDGVDSIIAGQTPDVREAIALVVDLIGADVGKAESAQETPEASAGVPTLALTPDALRVPLADRVRLLR